MRITPLFRRFVHPTLIACIVFAIGVYAIPWLVSSRSAVQFDRFGMPLDSAMAPKTWLFVAVQADRGQFSLREISGPARLHAVPFIKNGSDESQETLRNVAVIGQVGNATLMETEWAFGGSKVISRYLVDDAMITPVSWRELDGRIGLICSSLLAIGVRLALGRLCGRSKVKDRFSAA